MTDRAELKLLPCPFCGGSADFEITTNDGQISVECNDCAVWSPCRPTEAEAAAYWNTRALPSPPALPGERT